MTQLLRNFCFTLNNPNDEDIKLITDNLQLFEYLTYGREVGKSGTPHLQGYAELVKRTRFGTIHNLFPKMHIEDRKGTQSQAIKYCHKDDPNPFKHGCPRRSGDRVDLDKIREVAKTGGMRKVVNVAKNYQQMRVAEKWLEYCEPHRNWLPTVIWIWGPTGTGKSRAARDLLDGKDYFTKNQATKWWTGYDGHEAIVIDDFRPSWWDLTYMLALIDRYEFKVETKGGHRQILAKTIIITSAMPPQDCYQNTGECVQQLVRRCSQVIHMDVPIVPEVGGNTCPDPGTPQEKKLSGATARDNESPMTDPTGDDHRTHSRTPAETNIQTHNSLSDPLTQNYNANTTPDQGSRLSQLREALTLAQTLIDHRPSESNSSSSDDEFLVELLGPESDTEHGPAQLHQLLTI